MHKLYGLLYDSFMLVLHHFYSLKKCQSSFLVTAWKRVFYKSLKKTGKVQELSRSTKSIGYRPYWNQIQLARTLGKELSMVTLTRICARLGKHDHESGGQAVGLFFIFCP